MFDSLLGRKGWFRLFIILFAGLILAGGGMIVSSLINRDRRLPDPTGLHQQDPDWIRQSPLKEYFTNYLQTIEPTSPIASLIRVYLMSLSRSQFGFTSARAEFRMTRTLRSCHELESSAVLTYERGEDVDEFEMHIMRSAKEPFTCRVVLREGAVEHVDFGNAGDQGNMLNANLLHTLPIGLGDLQLSDLMGFYRLLASGLSITPVGYLEAEGTEKLLVLEMEFPPSSNAASEDSADSAGTAAADTISFAGRGASALVYIHPGNYTLRRVLIFDAANRLVRIYEDFAYQSDERGAPIDSFRASSLVTNSHTVFHLVQLTLDD
jgi:hypothetical protein